jgi:hypothetical protein
LGRDVDYVVDRDKAVDGLRLVRKVDLAIEKTREFSKALMFRRSRLDCLASANRVLSFSLEKACKPKIRESIVQQVPHGRVRLIVDAIYLSTNLSGDRLPTMLREE